MNKVRIEKPKLAAILETNKAEHREIFIEAQKQYRAIVIGRLDASLKNAREGRNPAIRELALITEPQDHTADYDRALKMLSLSVDDVIELDDHQFRCLVDDEWEWTRAWAISNSAYVEASKLSKWKA